MNIATTISLITLGLIMLFGFGTFGLISVREGEHRAARVALGVAVLASLPFFLISLLPVAVKLLILGVIVGGGIVLFLLPIGRVERGNDVPRQRFDERDIMFARWRLVPGSPQFESYYTMRPENQVVDDEIRALPGLLSLTASKANPLAFASAEASFCLTEALREEVDGPVAPEPSKFTAAEMTSYIKGLARYYGAYTVGITELQPYHVYSHIGRGSGEYGAPIALDHRYAIAFTVEMDHAMMGTAPNAPTAMESARQYVEAARVALQLGCLIRWLGYPARAHIDGNYRVIAPLVARDAGLGEIGRMGLLMTPELGPRVRLGVVTTDLPLIPDQRDDDTSVLDFCRICQKCAETCPGQSIPLGGREEIDGALRWRINANSCFRYWNLVGTDCGRCMAVCPYSHPNNAVHNLVRWAVRCSGAARRAAFWMDDLFYGRKPAPHPAPDWAPLE
jgi:reductive dehalogenase